MRVVLPNQWSPKPHQCGVLRYLEGGGKRAVCVWHRRAGKDSTVLNWTAVASMQRVGTYWHMLPTLRQARLVVWDGINGEGQRIVDQVWPEALRSKIRHDEMKIELVNGAVWQLVGSDNYDSLVGSNPVGVVFSEWSLTDPCAKWWLGDLHLYAARQESWLGSVGTRAYPIRLVSRGLKRRGYEVHHAGDHPGRAQCWDEPGADRPGVLLLLHGAQYRRLLRQVDGRSRQGRPHYPRSL